MSLKEEYKLIEFKNPEFENLIRYLFTRQTSTYLLSFGRRETGKTNDGFVIMEILKKWKICNNFATNVKIHNTPFQIDHIDNMNDLTYWCETIPGTKFYMCDEFGKAFKRRAPMSKLTLELLDKFQILRKYKLHFHGITIIPELIDSMGLNPQFLDGYFQKTDFKNYHYGYYKDLIEPCVLELYDHPKTTINFDTWDIAPFTLRPKLDKTPLFKDRDLKLLYLFAIENKTYRKLGVHPQEMQRIIKKFIKENLAKHDHTSHN
jgi:hypothetical protein